MEHGAKSLCRVAKSLVGLHLVTNIALWMRSLPCENPSYDSNYIKKQVAKANEWLDRWQSGGGYCLDPNWFSYPDLCLSAEKKDLAVAFDADDTPFMRTCRGPIGWDLTTSRVQGQYYDIPWRGRRWDARPILKSYLSDMKALVEAMNKARTAARDYIAGANALVFYEEEYNVNANTKVDLHENFVNAAEEEIEERLTPPSYVPPPPTPSTSPFYKYIFGVFGIAGGLIAAKTVMEKRG